MDRFAPDSLATLAARIAQAAGMDPDDSAILADALVDADVNGVSTHGVSRLNIYVQRMRRGLIDPRGELRMERVLPGVIRADAGNGVGQVQAVKVLDELMAMARQTGAAAAAIHNSQHFGTLSYYCNRAAARDMILFAVTNCEPSMAPTGGCDAFFGTNPLGMSFPTGTGFPARVDMATSKVARGNIIVAHKKGECIPGDWALDKDGNPTTDAETALMGTVMTMAGHKGYALAFMVEALAGVLAGAAVGPAVGSMYKNMDRSQGVGHFFFLVDIAAFMDPAEFKGRMDSMIDALKAGRKRCGCEEILVPGELEHRRAAENRAKGVVVDAKTLDELKGLCAEFGIPFTL
jgi:LDH2 family malate/lactate/ureidoglycolate dehydrogenase